MPRNGSGAYSLPSGNPVTTGTLISSSGWGNPTLNDIAAALTQSISKDGQTTPTANLPMGNFNFTSLGAPTGAGQALRWDQLTKGAAIASASTITIPNEGSAFDITGTTTVTALSGSYPGRIVYLRFVAALTLTNSASLLLPNGKDLKPYPNEVFGFCCVDSGVWECVVSPPRLPALYRSGGTLTPSTTSVTIAPGTWRSADDSTNIILPSAISKTIQSSGSWAAGSGSNGLFSGALATSTWYHVFVMRNTTTGAVDAGFDTSIVAANIPVGWVAYRRVGSVFVTIASQILPFIQTGKEFRYLSPQQDVSNVGIGAPGPVGISVPAGVVVFVKLGLYLNLQGARAGATAWTPGDTDRTGVQTSTVTASTNYDGAGEILVMTNTSQQVTVRSVFGSISSGFYLQTRSYFDFVGD
jgi:hypothetical protein